MYVYICIYIYTHTYTYKGWVHWMVFMTSLYKYYALSLVLVEDFVGCNTDNARTPPLAVHSQYVATKQLWW